MQKRAYPHPATGPGPHNHLVKSVLCILDVVVLDKDAGIRIGPGPESTPAAVLCTPLARGWGGVHKKRAAGRGNEENGDRS
jgi:hypothetical protein